MSNRNIDLELTNAFDHASLEQIDELLKDIQVEDLQCPDDLSKQRMKKVTMKKIGKKAKKRKSVMKTIVAAAAAFVIMFTATLTFSAQAKELVQKLFSFIPGVGVVESEVPYYVLSEDLVKGENDYLEVEIIKVFIDKDILTLQYKVDMKKVDIDTVGETVLQDDPQRALLNYYKDLGYDQYFEMDNYMKTISSLELKKKELSKTVSETFFSEASGRKYALVTESYALGKYKEGDIKNAKLTLGDVTVTFSLKKAKQYGSKKEVFEDRIICTKDSVSIACEPVWNGDKLKVAFYVIDTGDYKNVDSLFPYHLTDKAGAYLMIDGKRIDGGISIDDVCPNTVVFDVTGYDEKTAYEIRIDEIAAVKEDAIQFKVNDQLFAYDDYSIVNVGVVPKDEAEEIYGAGDVLKLKVEQNSESEDKQLQYFSRGNGYEPIYIDYENHEYGVNLGYGNGNQVTLTDPVYLLNQEFVFAVNKSK